MLKETKDDILTNAYYVKIFPNGKTHQNSNLPRWNNANIKSASIETVEPKVHLSRRLSQVSIVSDIAVNQNIILGAIEFFSPKECLFLAHCVSPVKSYT